MSRRSSFTTPHNVVVPEPGRDLEHAVGSRPGSADRLLPHAPAVAALSPLGPERGTDKQDRRSALGSGKLDISQRECRPYFPAFLG